VALGGCLQQTHQTPQTQQPASDAGWTPRDQQLMSNLPYRQVVLPDAYRRQIVQTCPTMPPALSSSIPRTSSFITCCRRAKPYATASLSANRGRRGAALPGLAVRKNGQRGPQLPANGKGLASASLHARRSEQSDGSRGMYLFSGDKDTLCRIHGTNQPQYIGSRHFFWLHPLDQRGCDRPLQSGQDRHASRCVPAGCLFN
jgi:hypothetical protein